MIDFLVVGGGIAGVSAAAELSKLGSVTLLETESALGYHASGRSAAMYVKGYGNRVVRALNAASEPGLIAAGVLAPRGVLVLGRSGQSGLIAAACEADDTDPISVDEAVEMVPVLNRATVAHAAWTPDARDVDTDRMLQGFVRAARANGAKILTGTPAQKIRRDDKLWHVTTPQGEIAARVLVNAAGAWADRVAIAAGLPPIGLTPFRRSFARTPAPGGHDVSGWPFLNSAAEDWYARPDAGKWLISPSEEYPQEPHDAWADDMVLAEGIARYQTMVTAPETRVETSWAGLRTFAPDRTLVLGPDPLDNAFVWCAGQGGYGFQTAFAASATLAMTLGGNDAPVGPDIVAALGPSRFAGRG